MALLPANYGVYSVYGDGKDYGALPPVTSRERSPFGTFDLHSDLFQILKASTNWLCSDGSTTASDTFGGILAAWRRITVFI